MLRQPGQAGIIQVFTKSVNLIHPHLMNSLFILAIYLGLFVLSFLVDWFLDILNINFVLKNHELAPANLHVDESTYARSVKYTLRKSRFGLVQSLAGKTLILIVLFTEAAGTLDTLVHSMNLSPYLQGLIFLILASMLLWIAALPGSLYSRFVIEEEFGFNTTSFRTFFGDIAKQAPIALLILAAFLGGLYLVLKLAGDWWWAWAWSFWMLFQLLMVVLFPLLIAPLFNKFTTLPEGTLRSRITALADRCGFPSREIFVIDGSRRSKHSNAYFTGIGKIRRIVIFDTLIESLQEDEIEAVLAHEIGHWKSGHIRKRLTVSALGSLILFSFIGLMLGWENLFLAFGFNSPSLHALLFCLTFYAGPLSLFFSPIFNSWSRKHEYQADRFAVKQIGDSTTLKGALLKLGKDNLNNLRPHPIYSFWHYSHPPLSERLAALEVKV